MRYNHATLAGAIAALFASGAIAAPQTGSSYYGDPQESYVFDQTSESINTVNMISCIFDAMNADELMNKGSYIALVDQNRCSSNRTSASNSGSNSGGGNVNFIRAIVNSTRSAASDPMRVRSWIENKEGNQARDIWVNIRASEGPSSANPYGDFRLDYCGPDNSGSCTFQGFLAGASTGISFAERESGGGGGTNTRQLFLTRSGNDSGAGAVRSVESGGSGTTEYRFSYNPNHYLRRSGASDSCFDRRLSQSRYSVWRYGVYNADGSRANRNSGFPISFTSGGQTYQGWAGYHGVHVPPGATLTTGQTVTKQNFSSGAESAETYTVVKAKGRLTKYTKQSTTLAGFTNVRFNFGPFNGLSDPTANAIKTGETNTSIRNFQLETYWDATDNKLKVSGYMNCGSSGCTNVTLASPVALTNTDLTFGANYTTTGIFGWSQSYGGPVSIPAATVATMTGGSPTGAVYYRTQDIVYPGSAGAPANLYCVTNCPTGVEIANLIATTATEPWAAGTENRWSPTASAPMTYTFNATSGNLEYLGAPVVVADGVTESQLTGQWRNGIMSSKLLPQSTDFSCGGGNFCAQNADAADVYYEWQTGVNSWNQFIGLKSGSTYVTFDPPLALRYTVPTGTQYGEFAGSTLVLQFSGFGELHGIPGRCVSPATNLTVS